MITDAWIVERRGAKARLDPLRAYGVHVEEELDARGVLVPTAVILLTNRECPFRCVFCDLWRSTLDETVPTGAIPAQIRDALSQLPPVRQLKLYNAGSFFDPAAIPPEDDEPIARLGAGFDRVIVEAHPGFLTGAGAERCRRFRELLDSFPPAADATSARAQGARLEVAVGLETAHPQSLARLNKRMTVESFRRATGFLRANDIDLRVFVLLNPPFLKGEEAIDWACRSLDVAAECGATVSSVIPTRPGNGAIEALGDAYEQPRLRALERVIKYGVSLGRMRVFADLWDIERFFDCACSPARLARLLRINRTQMLPERVSCERCAPVGCGQLGVGS